MCRAGYWQCSDEGQFQEWLVWCVSARLQCLIDCQACIITTTDCLICTGYIKLSKLPPTTPLLLYWSTRLMSNESMKAYFEGCDAILHQEARRITRRTVICHSVGASNRLVGLLSVFHLPTQSNTTASPKQTSFYPVGQWTLLGHKLSENNLDTHEVCRSKQTTWIQARGT